MTVTLIQVFHVPCIYASDFNCHHTDWRYNSINSDRECLAAWAANNDLTHHDLKNYPTFYSGCWKSETNPNLAFMKTETTCQLLDW